MISVDKVLRVMRPDVTAGYVVGADERKLRVSIVDECELIVWRELQPRLDQAITSLLCAYGDHAPKDLIELQHTLAELGRPPFGAKQIKPAKENGR